MKLDRSELQSDTLPEKKLEKLKEQENNVSSSIDTFQDLNLSSQTLKAIDKMGFTKLTPLQARTIPPLLVGRDLLGPTKIGSGKALALTHVNGTGIFIITLQLENSLYRSFGVPLELLELQSQTLGIVMGSE